MNRRLAFFVAAVIAPISFAAAQAAQSPSASQSLTKPTLTIARFQGAPRSNSADPGGDLADAVAILVEESACCRVMPREWLPPDKVASSLSPAKLRAAAAAAGVEYVVIGNITQSQNRRPARPIGPISVGPRPLSPYGLSARPATPYVAVAVSTLVTVEVRVLASSSGEVVRTLRMDRTATTQSGPIGPGPQLGQAPGAIGAALAVSALRLKAPPKPALGGVLASMAPDVAGALTRAVEQLGQVQRPIGGLKPAEQ